MFTDWSQGKKVIEGGQEGGKRLKAHQYGRTGTGNAQEKLCLLRYLGQRKWAGKAKPRDRRTRSA